MKDVFISGWCGYPELFGGFAEEFEFAVPFVTHSLADIEELLSQGGSNLFAWSTGAYIVLDQRTRPPFKNIVLAAPFLKFTKYTSERVIEMMIKKFTKFPAEVVEDFYKRCAADVMPPYDERHFHIKLNGLRFLSRTDITEPEYSLDGVILLHGREDQIVSAEASRDILWLSDCKLFELEGTGHFIPPDTLRRYKI